MLFQELNFRSEHYVIVLKALDLFLSSDRLFNLRVEHLIQIQNLRLHSGELCEEVFCDADHRIVLGGLEM